MFEILRFPCVVTNINVCSFTHYPFKNDIAIAHLHIEELKGVNRKANKISLNKHWPINLNQC